MKSIALCAVLLAPFLSRAQTKPVTFEQAISEAFSNRASVQAARIRVDQARASRRSLSSAPPTSLLLGISSDRQIGSSDDDLALSHPLDVFGRTSAARATGDALVTQAEAGLRRAKVDLQSDVYVAYADAVASTQRLRISQEAENSASQLLDAVRKLVDGGRLPGVQATRVSIEFARAQSATKQRESELAASLRRLSGATGVNALDAGSDFPSLVTMPANDAALKSQRPDLLTISAEVKAAEADTKVIRANRRPQLDLQARRTAWQDRDIQFGLRLQLSAPLFDSGRSRSDINALAMKAEAANRDLADALRLANTEQDAVLIEVAAAKDQVSRLETVLETSRDLYARTNTGLKEGANTLFDTIDALRSIREIEEGLVDARLTLAKAQGRHLRVTGQVLEVRP